MGTVTIQEIAGPRIVISGDESYPGVTIESIPGATIVIAAEGVQGPGGGGGGGGGGGAQQVFIQPDAPAASAPFIWIETGLEPANAGFTVWFEDGV